jgi:hypothetical protein
MSLLRSSKAGISLSYTNETPPELKYKSTIMKYVFKLRRSEILVANTCVLYLSPSGAIFLLDELIRNGCY